MNRVVGSVSPSTGLQRLVGSGAIRKPPNPTTGTLRVLTTHSRITFYHLHRQETRLHQNVTSTIPANNFSRSSTMALATMATAGMILLNTNNENEDAISPFHHHSSFITHCERSSSSGAPTQSSSDTPTTIQFSQMGVNREDVEALVQVIMKDPSVNISMLPDALEAQLYKSTILLTLNAIYSLLGWLDGVHILSHELKLSMKRNDPSSPQPSSQSLDFMQPFVNGTIQGVNDDVLRQVAQRLLKNPVVNASWIPDALEEQIYTSCLQVVFRVLQIVLATFTIEICGHELTLQLAASPERLESALWAAAAAHSASSETLSLSSSSPKNNHHRMTPIDLDLLHTLAQGVGVDENTNPSSVWNRLFTRTDFVQQLHVSLYGLILGILDDLFSGQFKVQLLSDDIVFDLVPSSTTLRRLKPLDHDTTVDVTKKENERQEPSLNSSLSVSTTTTHSAPSVSSKALAIASSSFVAGIGVGVIVMTLLSRSQS